MSNIPDLLPLGSRWKINIGSINWDKTFFGHEIVICMPNCTNQQINGQVWYKHLTHKGFSGIQHRTVIQILQDCTRIDAQLSSIEFSKDIPAKIKSRFELIQD